MLVESGAKHSKFKTPTGRITVDVRPDGQTCTPDKIATQHDQPLQMALQVALTLAFYWQQLLEPVIIQAILAGHQPRCMSLLWFQRNPLPTDWVAQREIFAGFDA